MNVYHLVSCLLLFQLLNHVWLCSSMDCSLPGTSVHGILQVRRLEWVAMYFPRGSSWPTDRTCLSCSAGGFSTTEPPGKPIPIISVQFGCSVVSNSLQPHGLQHARAPCPSPTPAQTHVHRVSDAIQPSHPLSSPSPPAFSLAQGFFQWVSSSHQVAKVLEFQLQLNSYNPVIRKALTHH